MENAALTAAMELPPFPPLGPVPVGRYTEREFHDLEQRHLWPKTWLHVGHVSELPEPGSYMLFERLGRSIIISRGKDDAIRAFHNVCRHRGARLLNEASGRAGRFVCPYHGWSYAGDGGLAVVPEEQDFPCLDKADNGLVTVRCSVWRGMIYINLDTEAPPLDQFLAPFALQFDGFPLEDFTVKRRVQVELECNWKAAYDNFLEIYHVRLVHPQTIAPHLDAKTFAVTLLPHGHARFRVDKRQSAVAMFGRQKDDQTRATAIYEAETVSAPLFPNGFTAIDPAGFAWQTFWPIDQRRTLMDVRFMGAKDNDDDAYWDGLRVGIGMALAEDMKLFGGVQANMESGAIGSVLFSSQERMLYWYQQEIDRLVGEAMPARFRLDPVLAPEDRA